jgi:peptide/nickel transport system permease protein/dipeptide transport system permease protein
MVRFLAQRLFGLVLVLLTLSLVVFCLQNVVPADPARARAGPTAPTATVEAIREQMGLDDPIIVQYARFLSGLARGDLGVSVRTRQPVTDDLRRYLPASLELGAFAMIVGIALAGLLALVQTTAPRSSLVRLVVVALGSTPVFLSTLLLAYVFWFQLGWLPGSGRLGTRGFSGPTGFNTIDGIIAGRPDIALDALLHLILPATALALPVAVAVGRSLSGALYDVMQQPYVRTVRGKGVGEARIVLRHGLRNAASAPLAMIGLQVLILFGHLLIVERVFGWPGIGLYTVQAFTSSDFPAVLGVFLAFGAIYILTNMVIELVQSLADPRIRL